MTYLKSALFVVIAYVLAHGLTAFLITPVQSRILPDITAFASLVYLPHGVRVLATWLMGWSAVPALFVGGFLSEVLFTPDGITNVQSPVMLASIIVGAISAVLAFEVMRFLGHTLYAGQTLRIHWKWLLLVGVIASILNSIGQSIVFSAEILTGHALAVLAAYAVGDLVGLSVTTLILMLVFRWMRLSGRG
ncbi:MAG: hypothetical protein ACU0CY_10170 [Maritimibacter harenae]